MILAFISGIGTTELVIIFLVVLLLFGSKKLPELARGMGKAINEFKKASSEVEKEFKSSVEDKASIEDDTAKPSVDVKKDEEKSEAKS